MSLINEALKKAQMNRQGKDAPAANHPSISAVAAGGGAQRTRLVPIATLGVVVAAVAGLYWAGIFGGAGAPEPVEVPAKPAAAKPPAAPVVAEAPKADAAAEVKPPAEVSAEPVAVAPVVPEKAAEPVAPVAPAPTPEVEKPAVPVLPVKSPAVETLVGLMNLSMVRKSTGRCVIDGAIYKVGAVVKADPLIKIESIGDAGVVFTDARGVRYEKSRN